MLVKQVIYPFLEFSVAPTTVGSKKALIWQYFSDLHFQTFFKFGGVSANQLGCLSIEDSIGL